MAADGSWFSSRKATNQLLGLLTVVVTAGFVSVGEGFDGLRLVADLFLGFVFVGAIVLFLGYLIHTES